MFNSSIELFDLVALTQDLPKENLFRGQVGTVVEILPQNAFEVEFSDSEGQTFALLTLNASILMLLSLDIEAISS